jgi:AcrR family transcriptional regulator
MKLIVDGSAAERRDARENRERILVAARQELAERGLDAEMKDIAARAGVGVGTLYRHFASREGLVAAIIEQTHSDLRSRIEMAITTASPSEAFRAIIRAGAEVFEQFGALSEIALAGEFKQYGADRGELDALLQDLVWRGIEAGQFRRDLDLSVLMAMTEAIFTSGKLIELAKERSFTRAADDVASFLLRAVAAS